MKYEKDTEVGKLGPGEMFDEGGMLYFYDLLPSVQSDLAKVEQLEDQWHRMRDWVKMQWEKEQRYRDSTITNAEGWLRISTVMTDFEALASLSGEHP